MDESNENPTSRLVRGIQRVPELTTPEEKKARLGQIKRLQEAHFPPKPESSSATPIPDISTKHRTGTLIKGMERDTHPSDTSLLGELHRRTFQKDYAKVKTKKELDHFGFVAQIADQAEEDRDLLKNLPPQEVAEIAKSFILSMQNMGGADKTAFQTDPQTKKSFQLIAQLLLDQTQNVNNLFDQDTIRAIGALNQEINPDIPMPRGVQNVLDRLGKSAKH